MLPKERENNKKSGEMVTNGEVNSWGHSCDAKSRCNGTSSTHINTRKWPFVYLIINNNTKYDE